MRNATHIKTIGEYRNKTKKLVWYERYNQKCCLALAAPTSSGEKNLYKMKVSLTRDELLAFYECLVKVKKGGHDFILSEGEDFQKNPTRLVLRDSKYSGLVLHHMNAEKPLEEMTTGVPSGDEDDTDLVLTTPTSVPEVELVWVEAWAKFYISKNEDSQHVAKVIKYFLADVDHEMEVVDIDLIKKSSRLLKHEQLNKEQKEAYTLHSRKLIRYKRLGINVYKRNAQWSIDLADLNNLSGFNNQYHYLLVCVDVYSRYAFVKPLKTKSAKNVANKFEQILIEEGEIPLKIQSDEGTEFTLIKRDLAKKYGFTLFHTYNRETKAVHTKRFIETIKAMITRSLTTLNQGYN
jgi:hypothetical protein